MGALIIICGALCSTAGTLALPRSRHFRHLPFSLLVLLCYGVSTCLLALAMDHMPVALAHAAWSGLVALLLLAIERWVFKRRLALSQGLGLAAVLSGIAVLSA